MRLPPELRNRIYEYVLGGRTIHITKGPYGPRKERLLRVSGNEKHFLSLLGVSRQLYGETAVLPLKLNTFSARDPHILREWLASLLPVHRDAVSSLLLRAQAYPGCVYRSEFPWWWTRPEWVVFAEARGLRRIRVHTSIDRWLIRGKAPQYTDFQARMGKLERVMRRCILSLHPGVEVTMERAWEDCYET